MSYMWNEFNIKTFPAETIVYRDGVYCPDLSTLENKPIDKKYDLPVHIIYIGEITGNCRLNIELNSENQPVFLTVKIKNKKPAFFNIFIKNTGKNSKSVLSGTAKIHKNCDNCNSDINFLAMIEEGAKIEFMPTQEISSIPKTADHSAGIYTPNDAQVLYLRQAGLGILEIKDVTKEAFLNDY